MPSTKLSTNGVDVEVSENGDVVVHTNGRVETRPAKQDTLEVGNLMKDGTIYAGKSPDTGKPMFVTAQDARLAMTFNEAAQYAANVADNNGVKGFRLPTKNELAVIYKNQDRGVLRDTFNPTAYYWSSNSRADEYENVVSFMDGRAPGVEKIYPNAVRCVRS